MAQRGVKRGRLRWKELQLELPFVEHAPEAEVSSLAPKRGRHQAAKGGAKSGRGRKRKTG